MIPTQSQLEHLRHNTNLMPDLRVEREFVMEGDKNVAFIIRPGPEGQALAGNIAGMKATVTMLLNEIDRLKNDNSSANLAARVIADLEKEVAAHRETIAEKNALLSSGEKMKAAIVGLENDNLAWWRMIDTERSEHQLSKNECERLKVVLVELQDAHRKLLEAGRQPIHKSTELKSSGPSEYAVVTSDNIDTLVRDVNAVVREGWQPAGGICAENTNVVLNLQPQTRFYQAVTR